MASLDDKDLRILDILKENSNLTTSNIAKKVNLPITTVHNRIKKLERTGIITSYTVVIDYKKLGKPIQSHILVTVNYTLSDGTKIKQEDVAKKIRKLAGVEKVSIITGGIDMIINVRVSDVDELNSFVIDKLRSIDGVDKTQTTMVLSEF